MAEGPIRALTGRRRTRLTSTGCRNPWQPEPGRAPLIAAQAAVQTNGTTSLVADGESDAVPFWTPVNEISFWAWAGGSLGYINPFAHGRGNELKAILVRAAIASIEAVRDVNPNA